jgi:hypothetical protein
MSNVSFFQMDLSSPHQTLVELPKDYETVGPMRLQVFGEM